MDGEPLVDFALGEVTATAEARRVTPFLAGGGDALGGDWGGVGVGLIGVRGAGDVVVRDEVGGAGCFFAFFAGRCR